ncbi:MAG: tyrosine-type recombinase/integrase [candidate division Zixibacteria bacterium]|nr:tyrosine-type recombinase/integrase [candidate division Zixibacteria bacterium]
MKRIEAFLKYLEEIGRSKTTIITYKGVLEGIWKALGTKIVYPARLQEYFLSLNFEKPRTLHKKLAVIKSYFQWLIRTGVVKLDPTPDVVLPPIPYDLPKAVEYDELQRVIEGIEGEEFIPRRDRAIFELGYAIGARVGDLRQANVEDLDMDRMLFHARGKGNKEAYIPFGESARDALQKYLEKRTGVANGESTALFLNTGGSRLTNIWKIVKKYTTATPHSFFRHSAATHLLQNGAELRDVQEFMRHASPNTTALYTKVNPQRLRSEYNAHHPRARR